MLSHLRLTQVIKKVGMIQTLKYVHNMMFDQCDIISSKWLDYRATHPDLYEKPKSSDAITYSGCVSTEITVKDNDIILTHMVWNGNTFDGTITSKRCQFVLRLPYTKLKGTMYKFVSDLAEGELRYFAVKQYMQELEDAKKKRIDEIYKNLLDNIK